MTPMARLTDDEVETVMLAARPLAPHQRDAFLRTVADELARCGMIGPGALHRICVSVQRQFLASPVFSGIE
jgi:hypothetical protein